MRTDTYTGSPGDQETIASPFAGLSYLDDPQPERQVPLTQAQSPFEGIYTTESPFGEINYEKGDDEAAAAMDFLEAIHDEEFDDALEQLLNEGAAHALVDAQQWSEQPSAAEIRDSLEQWIAPLSTAWENAVDALSAGMQSNDLGGLAEQEIDGHLHSLVPETTFESPAFEQLFGSIVGKVVNVAKKAVAKVGQAVAGPIIARVKGMGLNIFKGVLAKLLNPLSQALPASVRPLLPLLTKRLGIGDATQTEGEESTEDGTAAELAHAFDQKLLSLYLTPEVDEVNSEADLDEQEYDALTGLHAARDVLARQLSEYTSSEPPVAEIEQFIPAVLAIRPLLKMAMTAIGGRDALAKLIAPPLAVAIKGMIGTEAASTIARVAGQEPSTMIARTAVKVGLSALGLETGVGQDESIPGEALASAVEDTVMRVADELSASTVADPLRVSAAVQRAFAQSAAAYLPDPLLRPDLPERETSENGGFWIMMPRRARPRYPYRKYSRTCLVSIPRQVARAVRWSDGGTLESYLLDRGVDRWPMHAEIDLYETMPGTFPGHFTADETLPRTEKPTADEFQPLTSEVAGVLLGEPALGRGRATGVRAGTYRPAPGQRFFRIRGKGMPISPRRQPHRGVSVRLDPATKRLRVAIRLSERRAQTLQAGMQRSEPAGQRDLPRALTAIQDVVLPRLQYRIARRLIKSSLFKDPAAAAQLAGTLAAATSTGISTFLTQQGAKFASVLSDPADGVTITVTFDGIDPSSSQTPPAAVDVVAGAG